MWASSSAGQSCRLITDWSRVQSLPGPPKRTCLRHFLMTGHVLSLGSVQFTAQLITDGFLPLFVLLSVDHQGCTGLGMACFSSYCGNTNVRVGHQDADKGVPEHVGMEVPDTGFVANPSDDASIAVRAERPSMIIADHKIVSCQRPERIWVLAPLFSMEVCQLAPISFLWHFQKS